MSVITHPALLGELPVAPRTEHEASCSAAWWHGCRDCEADNRRCLDPIREWAESAYDLTTTGVLTLGVEVSCWSAKKGRFVWVERKGNSWHDQNRLQVTGYHFSDLTGEASFYNLAGGDYHSVWSRMEAGDAGYSFLVPPSGITTLPIRHGERNKKGYPCLRYTSCVFTPFADLPEVKFTPFRRFGTTRDWCRAYND